MIRAHAIADVAMRFVRPTAFLMTVAMFVVGWRCPDRLSAFADAISKLPDHLWTIVDVLMGSIAGTKLVRDLKA